MAETARLWRPWRHYTPEGRTELLLTVTNNDAFGLWLVLFALLMLAVQGCLWWHAKSLVNHFFAPLHPEAETTSGRGGDTEEDDEHPESCRTESDKRSPHECGCDTFAQSEEAQEDPNENETLLDCVNTEKLPLTVDNLTRQRAIGSLVKQVLRRKPILGRKQHFAHCRLAWTTGEVHALYGIACLNIVVICVLWSTYVPFWLTKGSEEFPLVLSKTLPPDQCDYIEDTTLLSQLSESSHRLCWYGQDTQRHSQYCGEQPTIQDRLPVSVKMTKECPWGLKKNGPCRESHRSAIFSQPNIRPHDLGINTKALLSLSRRVICSPLDLEPFIIPNEKGTSDVTFSRMIRDPGLLPPPPLSVLDEGNTTRPDPHWTWHLKTWNGPNKYAMKQWSGHLAFRSGGAQELAILPPIKQERVSGFPAPHLSLLDSLRFNPNKLQNDGDSTSSISETVFILGYRAGQTWFDQQILDPIFNARTAPFSHIIPPEAEAPYFYWPDYEMSGLVCSEQFRVHDHATPSKSTPWLSEYEFSSDDFYDETAEKSVVKQNWDLVKGMVEYTSMYSLIYERGPRVDSLVSMMDRHDTQVRGVDPNLQWIKEPIAWMETGIIKARFSFQEMASQQATRTNAGTEGYDWDMNTCNQVLMRGANLTSIHFDGLCVSIALQLLIVALYLLPLRWLAVVPRLAGTCAGHVRSWWMTLTTWLRGGPSPEADLESSCPSLRESVAGKKGLTPPRQTAEPRTIQGDGSGGSSFSGSRPNSYGSQGSSRKGKEKAGKYGTFPDSPGAQIQGWDTQTVA